MLPEDTPKLVKAELIPFDPRTRKPKSGVKPIVVQFNPETLKLTRSNTFEDKSKGKEKNAEAGQFVSKSSAKLAFDLVFDTSAPSLIQQVDQSEAQAKRVEPDTDVRTLTLEIAKLFVDVPKAEGPKDPPKPNLCLFAWGAFQFTGMFESFNETLDFFSPGGKPLRATVSVSMVEDRFDYSAAQRTGPKDTKPPAFSPSGEDVPVAKTGGPAAPGAPGADPSSWRDTAMFNGIEDPKFGVSAGISVPGASLSASVGIGRPASAGFGFGASASVGTSIPGAFSASASGSASGVAAGGAASLGGVGGTATLGARARLGR
jgi:hypothetical protein